MRSFKSEKILPYNADIIHQIILDVEKYPEFLPWCSFSKVLSKEDDYFIAELKINFKNFSESYVSKVSSRKEDGIYIIEATNISGPFKYLKNQWIIKSQNNSSEVQFSIDFELKSKILDMVVGMFFSKASEEMMSAFETRARESS